MQDDISKGKEKRATPRLGKVLPIRFRLADEAGDKVYTATTKNISRGGLCLKVLQEKQELIEKLFQKGHKPAIDIEPPLPNQDAQISAKTVWINGRVEWAKKPDDKESAVLMGLKFGEMADDIRKKIYEFILNEYVKSYGESPPE
jgi:c-di-GMP-binding flagellar brake protein YcgR